MKKFNQTFAIISIASLSACGGGGSVATSDDIAAAEAASAAIANDNIKKIILENSINEAKKNISLKMRDPSTVQFKNLTGYRVGLDTTICGEFNAKNGFGLYSGYKTFYYRPGQSDLFKLIYQTEPTGSQSWLMDYEMSKLITTVCSNISTEAADAAQNNFLNPIANK